MKSYYGCFAFVWIGLYMSAMEIEEKLVGLDLLYFIRHGCWVNVKSFLSSFLWAFVWSTILINEYIVHTTHNRTVIESLEIYQTLKS